jgi:multiple sugar transport system permease protein
MSRRKVVAWSLVIPTILVLVIIIIYPLVFAVNVSLKNYDLRVRPGPEGYQFIGAQNFIHTISDSRFIDAISRTSIYIFSGLALQLTLGLSLALLLFNLTQRRSLLTALLLPSMIIPVCVGWVGRLLFHPTAGPINYLLSLMGLGTVGWIHSASTSLLTVILMDTWQWTPFVMLITYSGLLAFPHVVLESAKVDGAGSISLLRYIILPLIKPVLLVAILIRALEMIRAFDLIYVLTYGGPGTSSEVLTFYAFIVGFRYFNLGYAAAIGWILVIIVSVILTVFIRVIRS